MRGWPIPADATLLVLRLSEILIELMTGHGETMEYDEKALVIAAIKMARETPEVPQGPHRSSISFSD